MKKQICSFEILWQNSSPPRFAEFLKSATGQMLTCACRIPSPPGLQIFSKLPLDSYLHVLPEIPPPPPPICRFSKICYWTVTYMCLQKSPPMFADFPKSATHCRCTEICMQISPTPQRFADFLKSVTGQLLTCACFVPVWEIYSAILLLCSCLYFTQWRTTMNYPTWRHHVNS